MENKEKRAFPADENTHTDGGLTKREYVATQILSGISANRWSMELGHLSFEQLAKMAVEQADELFKELNK